MIRPVLALACAAALLAACGQPQTRNVVKGADGEKVIVESGSGLKPPADMPAFAEIMPGAVLTSVIAQAGGADQVKGGAIGFNTDRSPQQVMDWYRERIAAKGLVVAGEMQTGEARMIAARAEGSEDVGLHVTAGPTEEGGSAVTLVYNGG